MQNNPFGALRVDYVRRQLSEEDAPADPFALFAAWLADAVQAGVREANGMALATATAGGRPSVRVVLLKSVDQQGFTFFTNYASRKGEELAQNPYVSAVFWWAELERQVRLEGPVQKLPAAESDEYYRSRPRGAQLGAWASQQSQVIAGRQALEEKLAAVKARFGDQPPERPPFWGGYRLAPDVFEFWQGRSSRLHDRLRYRRAEGAWTVERLSP